MPLPMCFELANGMVMPAIGLGTFEASGDTSGVKDAISHALSIGYRHIDTAFNYDNEVLVGEAIIESGIPREEVTITTKLSTCWHRPEDVSVAFERSLKNLGLSYGPHCYVVEGLDRERLIEDTPYGKRVSYIQTNQGVREPIAR
ncbi:hypothetical protein MMC17_005442 [Xylographa soralifera]|nr:hypothetical protein [Xylographa soralifera]